MEKNEKGYYKLDYSLSSIEERTSLVNFIITNTDPSKLTNHYKQKLSDYILDADSVLKKEKKILTQNRLATINKREVSIEKMAEAYQTEDFKNNNGLDKIYNMLNRKQDKSQRLTQKYQITEQDIAEVPGLKQLRDEIESLEKRLPFLSGQEKYNAKKMIIDMRKDQYVLKNSAKPTIFTHHNSSISNQAPTAINEYEGITVDEFGQIHSINPYNFFNIEYVKALCNNYELLAEWAKEHYGDDLYYSYEQFQYLITSYLRPKEPFFYDLLLLKNEKKTNTQIKEILSKKYNITYALEYYSVLWRKRLPSLIVKYAEEDFLDWYFTYKEKGNWKKCYKCGEIKLRTSRFFSKNKCSPDGFYSVCKECRKKKYKNSKKEE